MNWPVAVTRSEGVWDERVWRRCQPPQLLESSENVSSSLCQHSARVMCLLRIFSWVCFWRGGIHFTTVDFLPSTLSPIIFFTWLQACLCLAWITLSNFEEQDERDMILLYYASVMSFRYTFEEESDYHFCLIKGCSVIGWWHRRLGRRELICCHSLAWGTARVKTFRD